MKNEKHDHENLLNYYAFYRYGKMKDQFGWPDDTEEITNATVGMVSGQSPVTNVDDSSSSSVSQPVAGPLDK